MGCGRSKDAAVTGNTVSHRRRLLLQKKPDPVKRRTTTSTIAETGVSPIDNAMDSIPDKGEIGIEEPPPMVADVKDIAINIEAKADGEGRLVSRDSPDQYFSSRKDEESVESITGEAGFEGFAYYSPLYDLYEDDYKADSKVAVENILGSFKAKGDQGLIGSGAEIRQKEDDVYS